MHIFEFIISLSGHLLASFLFQTLGHLKWSEGCSVVSDSLWPHGLYSPCRSPGQNTGVGSLFLLQEIFATQGSNPGLLHCRRILCQLSYQGSQCSKPQVISIFIWDPQPLSVFLRWLPPFQHQIQTENIQAQHYPIELYATMEILCVCTVPYNTWDKH